MAKFRNGTTEVARLVYIDPTFGDIFDSTDAMSVQANTFQTANWELTDADFGILDSKNWRGAVEGVSNDQAAGAGNGTRWIVGPSPAGDFAAFSPDQIVRSNGTTWVAETNPTKGTITFRKDVSNLYYFNNDTFSSGDWEPYDAGFGRDYRQSVKDRSLLTPPLTPANGDRYLIGQPTDTATDAWAGHAGEIATYNSTLSAWEFEPQPNKGTLVFVEDENASYYFNNDTFASGLWVIWNNGIYTDGNGIVISGNVISTDLLASGGLKYVSGQIGIEPSDFAGEGLKDDGSDNMAIDWSVTYNDSKAVKAIDLASNDAGKGATIIGIADANNYFTALNVEGALTELYESIVAAGVYYTAGAGGITKGDLVYASANNTVSVVQTTAGQHALGIALTTVSAGGQVRVLANDTIVTGILSGATAGTRYYWNGTGWQTSLPTTSGAYVWAGGIAKNATDLHVEVEFVKRNAA